MEKPISRFITAELRRRGGVRAMRNKAVIDFSDVIQELLSPIVWLRVDLAKVLVNPVIKQEVPPSIIAERNRAQLIFKCYNYHSTQFHKVPDEKGR